MSEPDPSQTSAPAREPRFTPMPLLGSGAAAALYGAAALAMAGIALYMAFARGAPLTSVPVFAPALGSLWFVVRVVMTLRPKV